MKKLAIFASGGGTNMEAITRYFLDKKPSDIVVACVITDQKNAYVRERSKKFGIPCFYMSKQQLNDKEYLLGLLDTYSVDAIVLAGYLRLVPTFLLEAYPERIVNIHPALLPKYGGKGMYGMNVHQAVKQSGERETGITIHVIDQGYDKGKTLFQAKVSIEDTDTPEDIANKVHVLEHKYFAPTIERWLNSN